MIKKIFVVLVILSIAAIVVFYLPAKREKSITFKSIPLQKKTTEDKKEVLPAIDFDFQDLNGKSFKLSDFKGKVIILSFRSTHCGACDYEMDFLESLYSKINSNPDIKLLPIFEDEKIPVVSHYIKKKGTSFPVYVDNYGLSVYKYKVFAVPTSYIIDKKFNLVARLVGVQDWSSEKILSFLNKLAHE